MPNNCWNI